MLRIACLFILVLVYSVCNADAVRPIVPKQIIMKPIIKQVAKAGVTQRLGMDTSVVTEMHFDAKALDSLKKLPQYQYTNDYSQLPSLWERFWKWFWSLFDKDWVKGKKANLFFKWIFIVLKYVLLAAGAFALIYLILKASGIDIRNVIRRKALSAPLDYTELDENIHDIDFNTEIERATEANNYRLAVRLLYLKSLKQLSDNGVIDWQPHKTNTNYINELTNAQQREEFKLITRQFEYVWYGDFLINSDIYKKIAPLFSNFKSSLS